MTSKNVSAVLLLFVGVSVAVLMARELRSTLSDSPSTAAEPPGHHNYGLNSDRHPPTRGDRRHSLTGENALVEVVSARAKEEMFDSSVEVNHASATGLSAHFCLLA